MPINSCSKTAVTAEELIEKTKRGTGLLCQCAGCKAIRDEHGQWWRFDPPALLDDFELQVTHGLCPDCEREATRGIELDD